MKKELIIKYLEEYYNGIALNRFERRLYIDELSYLSKRRLKKIKKVIERDKNENYDENF